MNHIYRSIWNDSTATYVAAAETSKSGGKRASSSMGSLQAPRWALRALSASLCLAYATGASALPQGGVVTAGSASVTATPGKVTVVQGSQSAVLNWQSFGIGAGEAVQFVQPNASAVALNRVVGTDTSAILGSLTANGKVFLVNPNGILFGKGASVNVGGLVASTLDITDVDFMAGRYAFSGNSAKAVTNQGTINAPGGYVAMLGAHVSNEGVIAARMGSVALAGGQAITLDVAGDGLLNVTVDQGAVNALVSNGGLIQADGGQVLMTAQAAGNLLHTVVNNTGVIQAQTLVNHNGTIKLLGDMQTGTVNAGGRLDASAPVGGNGGFIETSAAHVKIDDGLKVTTAALAPGLTGSWLIDPTDYTIAATGGDQTGAFYTNALKSSNVQIQSISGGSGVLGDIHVNDTISWSANKLTLTAQNNINVNKAMRGSGTASLALEYGQSAVASGNNATYNVKAEIDLPSGQNFSTKLGSDGVLTNYTVINSLGVAGSASGTDLQGIRGAVTANHVLGANIDATATAAWNGGQGFTPIGTSAVPFSGQFDGLGHVITGLNSATTAAAGSAGLFGSNTGSIRNIGVVAPVIGGNIAGAAGNIAGLAAINLGTISNAYVSGGSVTVTTGAIGAGLVALNAGTIRDSYNSSTVSVTGNYDFWMGGLVGNTTKTSTIINSYNSGQVTGTYTAGGLVGNNLGNIANSFNSGNVTGTTNTGGLASHNRGTGVITNSFNTGAVTSNSLTGGLVGSNVSSGQIMNSYSTGAVSSRGTGIGFGGLVGGNAGLIRNSYATGAVTGVTAVGGLIGANTSAGLTENAYASGAVSLRLGGSGNLGGLIGSIGAGTSPSITGGYYNTTANPAIPGVGSNGGTTTPAITGLTSAQMQVAANFGAFAFTTTAGATGNNWVIVNTDGSLNGAGNATGATRPMLAAEYSTTIYSSHQLQLMAMNLAGNYTLKQDINAAKTGTTTDVWNGSSFVPVGASTATPFTGTFDGAGHVISGLVINRPVTDDAGLFGATSATAIVRNVGLEGGSITGNNGTGALVGSNLGTVSSSYSTASVTGGTQVGGLVGANAVGSTVTNSYARGPVTGTGIIGGLVGSNTGTLANNYASGTVTGSGVPGGLVGSNSGSATGNFWDATTSGMATSAAGTGLNTAQMKLLATYSDASWDLTGTWIVYDTNTYPLLRAFMTPLQVTFASNASKTYDGTNGWTAPGATFSNPNAVLQGSLNYGDAGSAVNAGTYAITAGGLYSDQRGYAISANAATLTIGQKALTLTGLAAANKVYDGTTVAVVSGGSLNGLVAGETLGVTIVGAAFDDRNAGTGRAVTVMGSNLVDGTGLASNYTLDNANPSVLTADITRATISSVSNIVANTKVYDGNTKATVGASVATFNGMVTGDNLAFSATSASFADKNAGTGKVVTVNGIALGGTDAANYNLSSTTGSGTGTITRKAVTIINMTAVNKVYDGTTKASVTGGAISGTVGGETLGATGLVATFSDKNVGSGKTVTSTGTTLTNGSNGGLAANYTVTNPVFTANITPKALTVTGMAAGSKVYDGTTVATLSGGALSGLVTGETLVLGGGSGVFGDKNVGTGKLVTVSGISLADGTGLASNYTVSNPTSVTGNITQKALTVLGLAAGDKDYDGNTVVSLSGGSLSGLVGTESLSLTGLTGAVGDKNVGLGKAVTVTGATLANAGSGATAGRAGNYSVSNPTGLTANVTPKALTVAGLSADNKVYDGNVAAALSGGSLSGLVGGETLGLAGLSGTFSDKNAANGKTVTLTAASLVDGTGLASNYTVSNPGSLTANISQATIASVGGISAANKVYDGTTGATLDTAGAYFNGMLAGDSLTASAMAGAFGDKNVGAGKVVSVSGIALGGTDAGNYSLASSTASTTANITPKALAIAGMTADNKVFDGTTVASLRGGTLTGLVGGETLGLAGATGAFESPSVGSGKAVTVVGSTLTDGSGLARNYSVSNPTGLRADITPAEAPGPLPTEPVPLPMDPVPLPSNPATLPTDRPTAGNVALSLGGSSSPLVETGSTGQALSDLSFMSDGQSGPASQAGPRVPLNLSALGLTMTGNGIRLPAGVVPASEDGDN